MDSTINSLTLFLHLAKSITKDSKWYITYAFPFKVQSENIFTHPIL